MSIRSDHYVWDDLQSAIANAKLPASSAPTWTTWNFGIGGGVAFAVQKWDVNNYADLYYQTTHSTKIYTKAEQHIHWSCDTNAVGKKVKFQFDIIGAPIGETWGVISGSPFTAEYTMLGTEANKHNYFDITEVIDAFNSTVSTVFISRLKRIAAPSDEYANNFYIVFADAHILKDSNGSRFEAHK